MSQQLTPDLVPAPQLTTVELSPRAAADWAAFLEEVGELAPKVGQPVAMIVRPEMAEHRPIIEAERQAVIAGLPADAKVTFQTRLPDLSLFLVVTETIMVPRAEADITRWQAAG